MALSHGKICRPPPPPPPPLALSEVAIFIWKMRNALKRMKNHVSDFFRYIVLRYGRQRCKKKLFESGQNTGKLRIDLTMIFQLMTIMSFLCATISFWPMVDFVYDGLHHCSQGVAGWWRDTRHAWKILMRNMSLVLTSEPRVLNPIACRL